MNVHWVYFVECEADHLYVGMALDPITRFKEHCRGRGARCTILRRPVRLIGAFPLPTKREALSTENRIKRLRRHEKRRIALWSCTHPTWRAYVSGREIELVNRSE